MGPGWHLRGCRGREKDPARGAGKKKKKSKIQRNFKVQEGNCAGEGLGTGIPKDGDSQQLPNLDKTFRWINPVKYLISISVSEQPAALPSSELQAWSKKRFFSSLSFFLDNSRGENLGKNQIK